MRSGACLSSIHTNEKPKKHIFNHNYQHYTIKYISAIAWIKNKKQYIDFAVSPPLTSAFLISAVTLGISHGLSAALTTADYVSNLLLFGDLLYFVTGKDKEEPNQQPAIIWLSKRLKKMSKNFCPSLYMYTWTTGGKMELPWSPWQNSTSLYLLLNTDMQLISCLTIALYYSE